MPNRLPAILMLPPHGFSKAERWVAEGRLAAAKDLTERLIKSDRYAPIIIIAESGDDEKALVELGAVSRKPNEADFHFGSVLAACIKDLNQTEFAYFGGASAPLLGSAALCKLADQLQSSKSPMAITNNLHSSDWFMTNAIQPLISLQNRLPADNPLGWVYAKEAGIEVFSETPSAATRLDIDTPLDLVMLSGYPKLGPAVSRFVTNMPETMLKKHQSVKEVLSSSAQTLLVIGRASSHVWQQLEAQTQIWVRLIVEERGMVASRRLAKGEVRSVLTPLLRSMGTKNFLEYLAEISNAVIWDTRVWMAAELGWPGPGDRFASDLGWVEDIQNDTLRDLVLARLETDIAMLAGGYGVVSGGLYALLETMEAG